ncbi:MAG: hypothetical protein K2Q12_06595 [Rickettsiales bacterium]|nr:hypothetical protein [Rickettsiales bacterium]
MSERMRRKPVPWVKKAVVYESAPWVDRTDPANPRLELVPETPEQSNFIELQESVTKILELVSEDSINGYMSALFSVKPHCTIEQEKQLNEVANALGDLHKLIRIPLNFYRGAKFDRAKLPKHSIYLLRTFKEKLVEYCDSLEENLLKLRSLEIKLAENKTPEFTQTIQSLKTLHELLLDFPRRLISLPEVPTEGQGR